MTDLQHRIGEQQSVSNVVQDSGTWAADGVELKDLLGGLGLTSAALS